MATYVFALNTQRSHLVITTPTNSYAVPYLDLTVHAPQMPAGKEQLIFALNGTPVVAVPVFKSNLVGATWQDKLNDLENNYLFMNVGNAGTLTGIIAGAGIATDGAVPQPTIDNTSEGFYMDDRCYYVSATHPSVGTNARIFPTVTDAFAALEALAGTGHFSIYMAPGDYNEGPTLTQNQYELSLIALGIATFTGYLTMDCQGTGSVTLASEGGTIYGPGFFLSGNTTNQPVVRLEHCNFSNKLIDSSTAGGGFFTFEDCVLPHCHVGFLTEATNTSFCTLSDLVVDSHADRITNCQFGPNTVTINAWQSGTSGLRNCEFHSGASNWNGPATLQLDNNSYYSFVALGWGNGSGFLHLDRLPDSGVAAGSYTHSSITVDQFGIITSASNGAVPATSVGAPSTTSTASAADLTAGVLTLHHGGGTNPGIGHIQNYQHNNNCAAGYAAYPGYGTATAGGSNSAYGYQAFGGISAALNSPSLCTGVGYRALGNITTASGATAIGGVALQSLTSGSNVTAVGYGAGGSSTGASNTFAGALAGAAITGNNCLALGVSALSGATTGSNNIGLGSACSLAAAGNSSCLVIGVSAVGNGSNTTTISTNYVRAVAGGNALSQDAGTGEVTRAVSSLRYKTVVDQSPPVGQFAHYLFQLQPRGVTMNNDPAKIPRITYIAEEVEQIVGPKGNPVFTPLLIYADLPDPALPLQTVTETYQEINPETGELEHLTREVQVPTKRRMVDGINYAGFVVPLVELCKQQQAQIDALTARLDAAGIP